MCLACRCMAQHSSVRLGVRQVCLTVPSHELACCRLDFAVQACCDDLRVTSCRRRRWPAAVLCDFNGRWRHKGRLECRPSGGRETRQS
jgi:hypothetical protein